MPDVAVTFDWNAVIAIVGVLTLAAATSRWVYRMVSNYFDGRFAKATVNTRLGALESDMNTVKGHLVELVADTKTNGGSTTKDQNNRIENQNIRIEDKLNQLLGVDA